MIVTNSLTGGGAERSMNLLANELTSRGWPIALVPINAGETDFIEPECEVFPIGREWRGSAFNTLSAIIKFNKVISNWKPDVLILNCDLPEMFGAFTSHHAKLIVIEHSSIPFITRLRVGKVVRKILTLRGVTWVAVSTHFKIWPTNQKPTAILQNSLGFSESNTMQNQISSQIKRLVYVGRLSPEKHPEVMIALAQHLKLPTEIIGDGFLRKSLEEESLAEKPEVTFHGFLHQPWMVLKSGDLLIIPSELEGDGLVVIEGMLANLPILLSDIPDFHRFKLPEKHYCKDLDGFISKINEYRDNLEALVVSPSIKESIIQERSPTAIGQSWVNFLVAL